MVPGTDGVVVAHIEDRWWKTVRHPDGSTERVKTSLFGKGMRYRVRYDGPDGRERKKSFPDRQKRAAEDFLIDVESDKRRGTYIDPSAGRMLFRDYAENWLRTRTFDRGGGRGVVDGDDDGAAVAAYDLEARSAVGDDAPPSLAVWADRPSDAPLGGRRPEPAAARDVPRERVRGSPRPDPAGRPVTPLVPRTLLQCVFLAATTAAALG